MAANMWRELLLCVAVLWNGTSPPAPTDLRCNYLSDPVGVDDHRPQLSWLWEPRRAGARQRAYQIQVATSLDSLLSGRPDCWDSGQVRSGENVAIRYAGKPLRSLQRYYWRVRVWDERDEPSPWSEPATWVTGILDPQLWVASWISDPFLGPVRSPRNGFHSRFSEDPNEPHQVVLELPQPTLVDEIVLWPAKPFNWRGAQPGFLFPKRFRVDVQDDRGSWKTVVDRTDADVPNPGAKPLRLSFSPTRARLVRLTVTRRSRRDEGEEIFAYALAELEVRGKGRSVRGARVASVTDSIEDAGWSRTYLVDGRNRSETFADVLRRPATYLRREFDVNERVHEALLLVTGLGLYEVHLNGRRVGEAQLAPEFTLYHKRLQYRLYDVTHLVRRGRNAIGVILGDGWHGNRFFGLPPVWSRPLRGQRFLRLQLHLRLADGSELTVCSDSSWRASCDGAIRYASMYDGEAYDARKEWAGWSEPGFDDQSWAPAKVVSVPPMSLVAQVAPPIRITSVLKPVGITEPKPGVYVFDFGQNLAGFCRLRAAIPAGHLIRLKHGERLNDDGTVYTRNLRTALQEDQYIGSGKGVRSWQPRFTYHGFRYVEVHGLLEKPTQETLVALAVHTDAEPVSSFESGHPMLNRLMQAILWTQRSNLMSVPTDCPQRDERAGWMGDIQAFCETAMFNMDLAAFFRKWLADVRDSQQSNGNYPGYAPAFMHPGAPAWSDAGVLVPWKAYVYYADRQLLEDHFESAERYVTYVLAHNPDFVWRRRLGANYGDWLNGDTLRLEGYPRQGGSVPRDLFATAFLARSAEALAAMAHALGRGDRAAYWWQVHNQVVAAFRREFLLPDGRLKGDTQGGYALALHFGLLPKEVERQAAEHLLTALRRYGGRLSTGIQTTHRLMLALSEAGHHDVACQLLLREDPPSWFYMLRQGATTIWERWDGYVAGRGYQNPGMNSFNHWAFGSVGEWVWKTIVGLEPDPDYPGWRRFRIRPRPHRAIGWVRAKYRSVRGTIAVSWRLDGRQLELEVQVPAGCEAVLDLPDYPQLSGLPKRLQSGTHRFRFRLPDAEHVP